MVTQASQRHTQDTVVMIAFTCVYNGLESDKNPRHEHTQHPKNLKKSFGQNYYHTDEVLHAIAQLLEDSI